MTRGGAGQRSVGLSPARRMIGLRWGGIRGRLARWRSGTIEGSVSVWGVIRGEDTHLLSEVVAEDPANKVPAVARARNSCPLYVEVR